MSVDEYSEIWVFAEQRWGAISSVTHELIGEGQKLAALEKWSAAVRSLETARRAKRTPEVEALLAIDGGGESRYRHPDYSKFKRD